MRRRLTAIVIAVAGGAAVTLGGGCAGPQPLGSAIRVDDEFAYAEALNAASHDAREAFVNWMAEERHVPAEEVLKADAALSETHNPFDANKDFQAVSRGAVIYKTHCAKCHGEDARGVGPATLKDHPAEDFKTFGKRLAATLHRGAPRKWFRVISDGHGEVVDYPKQRTTAMPPFGDKLTREQIWLTITYLQSLDVYAAPQPEGD